MAQPIIIKALITIGCAICASLCSPNGQPAKQAKYIYSTLIAVSLSGCVVYASATVQ
jgi:hypothetical protein